MLIIFDVDGTLVGGEAHDWACFNLAIEEVTGFAPTDEFFASLPEMTEQAIAEAAVLSANRKPEMGLEGRICIEYLARLRKVHSQDPGAFPARDAISALLSHLDSLPGVGIAIATGGWRETSSFKLAAGGIDVSRYPIATSSDAPKRSEIIRLAAKRAGRSLSEAIYVGDGIWDLKVCRQLGIPFIGTGAKLELLRKAGAQHLLELMEALQFMSMARLAIQR